MNQICNYRNIKNQSKVQNIKQKYRQLRGSRCSRPISKVSKTHRSYIFVDKVVVSPDPLTQLLYYVKNDQQFHAAVNQFWLLFHHNIDGFITRTNVLDLGTLIYACLFPQLDWPRHARMAEDLLNRLSTTNLHGVAQSINYDTFCEYLLCICAQFIENIDLRSCVGLLTMLFRRVTDVTIVGCLNNKSSVVPYSLQVRFSPQETVARSALEVGLHKKVLLNVVYYEQEVIYDKELLISDETSTIVHVLKKPEQVIPLGYPAECVLWDLANAENFEPKEQYKLYPQEKLKVGELIVVAIMDDKAIDGLKDSLLNRETMSTQAVVSKQLPLYKGSLYGNTNIEFYRLSECLARPAYFEQLKQLNSDTTKFFNILSEFHERSEFGIDQIHNVGEKWLRKKKRNMLGDEKKKTVKKEEFNPDQFSRQLPLKSVTRNALFLNQQRLQAQNEFLRDKLKITLEEDRFINLDKLISAADVLPSDSETPFHQDILSYAKQAPLQIFVFGRPKCGKSSISASIAKDYDVVHVSVESVVKKVFDRVKFFEENPPEVDQNGVAKDGLTPLEKSVVDTLAKGQRIPEQILLDLLNLEMRSMAVSARGYILDLPAEYSDFDWVGKIIDNLLFTPKIDCKYFSHILELEQTDEEWKNFATTIMEKPEDLTLTSGYERYVLAKPKPPPTQDEDEDQDPPADGEEKTPLFESNLVKASGQVSTAAKAHLLLTHIHPRRHLKLRVSGKNVSELMGLLKPHFYKIPLAKKLEGADKELLGVGLEEKKLFRRWSPWGIIDPVELSKQKLVVGKSEFAAEYAGRVFLFENPINQEQFIALPQQYLKVPPRLPPTFNLVINGPRKSGKKTIAKLIANIYGLQVVDIEKIVTHKLQQQKAFTQPLPSNPAPRSTSVHLSQAEWKDFSKGNCISAKDILPIVFYHLGLKLQKKPLDWGIQRTEEEKAQIEKQREEKQKEEAAKKAAAKKNTKKKDKQPKEDERPRTPPLEDLPLKEIIPELNQLLKVKETRGYVIIGFPNNEEQFQMLKTFGVPIDKFILLNDNSQQAPNKILSKRLNQAQLDQVAQFYTSLAPVKEALGEEVFKEVSIADTPQNIVIRVRNLIDPFFCKPDEDSLNRVSADVQEDDDPVHWGFCDKYCPVVLSQGWLAKGKDDQECGIEGRRFRCFGEKELALFKQNPEAYLKPKNLDVPPRILFMGIRGVGLKTELLKINHKYKIPILNLKQNLLNQLENEKLRRKTDRYYNKGFKAPEYDEEGKLIEDPELNEDPADFDRKALEIQTIRKTFEGIQEILINGNFFDVEEDKVSTPLAELLAEARRLPQMVVMLKVDEKRWFSRVFDPKEVQKEHQKIVSDLKEQKQREKEEARKKALQAGEEYQQPADDQDLGAPKLEDMIAERKQKLIAQREADLAKLEQFAEAFKGYGVETIQLDCERDVQHVFDKIVFSIKPCLQQRHNRWHLVDAFKIAPERVSSFLDNFIAKESRFGKLNPLTLMRPPKPCPLIYKQRIYYLDSEEQREEVLENIKLLNTNRSVPQDIHTLPIAYIIGKPKTGKSCLAKALSKKTGMVIIKLKEIIEQFVPEHSDPTVLKIMNTLKTGETLSDQMMVDLIEKRVQMADCQKFGWILDGMPKNRTQAELLTRRGLAATCVFSVHLSENDIKKRVHSSQSKKYGYDTSVVFERLVKYQQTQAILQNYFVLRHNNLKYLDGKLSKWGLLDTAHSCIQETLRNRHALVRSLVTKQPSPAVGVGFSFNAILNNLSEWGNYCLVVYKTQREYAKCGLVQAKNLAHYKKKIYTLASDKEYKDFLENPDLYINSTPPATFSPPELMFASEINASYEQKAQNKGYCIVELTKKGLLKGNPGFAIRYKNKIFGIGKSASIKLFLRNPGAYELSKLQEKLPIEYDKKSELKKIAKRSDCTAFLEHHLGNIMMRVLAQLGYRRLKYPTVTSKETALKFLAISLKANNPNKDQQYRNKYKEKLEAFIKHCSYPQELRDEFNRKKAAGAQWQEWDEENLLKLCEEYHEFIEELKAADRNAYFSQFIS